ncbi:MAG: hypothetical protein HUJ26_20180 [Planctomycetaceae bacterium]|nr:hypothetical protein [Planctomycetaceae bacterium]
MRAREFLLIVMMTCPFGCSQKSSDTTDSQTGDTEASEPAAIPVGINTLEGFDADLFHYSDQGSGFFPMSVMRALKDSKTKKPFLEDLERFGLLPGKKSERNPEGFPVGIVTNSIPVGDDREIVMFGFTCAACHTSDLHYQGQVVRVEGSSGLFYVDALADAISDSLQATVKDPDEFWAFMQRLAKESKDLEGLITKYKSMADLESDGEFGKSLVQHLKTALEEIKQAGKTQTVEDLKASIAQDNSEAKNKLDRLKQIATELAGKSLSENSPLKAATAEKQKELIEKLLGKYAANIRDLKYRLAFLKTRKWLSQPGNRLPAGYGRADDFGTARVELFAGWNEKNMVPVNAPVSSPSIWKIDQFKWLHWNANSNSVIQRSIGESIGVGATFDIETNRTSVDIVNQMLMEQQIHKIVPPEWPSDVFGDVDQELAKRGEKLYMEHCADCHTPEGVDEKGLQVVKLFTLEEMGTDPLDATNYDRVVYKEDGSTIGFSKAIASLLEALQEQAKTEMSEEHQQLMTDLEADRKPVIWRDTMRENNGKATVGRMLEGVWATAPYLHNGSVPTLYHLLLPADERPKTFLVGSQEFDPKFVGFEWEEGKAKVTAGDPLFKFDTSLEGNKNIGHEFGTDLPDEDRWAIVEYLKIHKDPPAPDNVIKD